MDFRIGHDRDLLETELEFVEAEIGRLNAELAAAKKERAAILVDLNQVKELPRLK